MTLDDTRARRFLIAAAAAGLALRLAFGFLYWVDKPLTHDEHEYLALARGVVSGLGFVYDDAHETGTAQRFGRAPAYPLFLAALDAGRPRAHRDSRARQDGAVARRRVDRVADWPHRALCRRPASRRVGGRDRGRVSAARLAALVRVERNALQRGRAGSGLRTSAGGRSRAPGGGRTSQARSDPRCDRGRARGRCRAHPARDAALSAAGGGVARAREAPRAGRRC